MHDGLWLSEDVSASKRSPILRALVVTMALAVLYWRMPAVFVHPQFWAEDIGFFSESRLYGWASLSTIMVGYLTTIQIVVAMLASYFGVVAAPAIYNYTAILLTLTVVWLVISPRLDMPYKPLLALAVVIVPMGYEELGTLTNIQWILPIGAFAMLFMRAPASQVVLAGEAVFLFLIALSGPFSLFLTPLFLWRLFTASDAIERRRLIALSASVGAGALIQLLVIALHRDAALNPIAPAPYSWTLWINLPFSRVMTTFGPVSGWFSGIGGVAIASIFIVAGIVLACRTPYRTQKIFMLLFAGAIAFSGMYKFRAALESQLPAQRYFYVGSVFSLWFICCISGRPYLRSLLAGLAALAELLLLPVVAHTPRITQNLEWPVWSRYVASGIPLIIPASPPGFFLGFPAAADGPLARFAPWVGRNINELAEATDPSSCSGSMGPVEPLPIVNLQLFRAAKESEASWVAKGWAWDTARNRPVQLVALVDPAGLVIGFGLPGFRHPDEANRAPARSGWISMFYATPGHSVRAYGIVDDGRHICPLSNQPYFSF
jgi:hypothetical protein